MLRGKKEEREGVCTEPQGFIVSHEVIWYIFTIMSYLLTKLSLEQIGEANVF